jgi:hypothetical protein
MSKRKNTENHAGADDRMDEDDSGSDEVGLLQAERTQPILIENNRTWTWSTSTSNGSIPMQK